MNSTEPVLQPGFTALDLFEREMPGALRFDAASAFVTRSGIELLAALPQPRRSRLVCRAGHGITEPGALAMAADELGTQVRVVAGREAARFHPKLYLVQTRDRLVVLAGSGNLTAAGLRDNVEQFELHDLGASSPAAMQHARRFNELWERGIPLEAVRSTSFWDAWTEQSARRLVLRQEVDEFDAALDREASSIVSAASPAASITPSRGRPALMPASDVPGALDRWYDDAAHRRVGAGFLAEAIEEVHRHAGTSWALLALRSRNDDQLRFQLMLQNRDLIRLREDGCLIVGVADDPAIADVLRRFPRTIRTPGPDGVPDLTVHAEDLAGAVPLLRRVALAHVRSRRGQARSVRANSHSRAAVEEIARAAGRPLPQPLYASQ